MDRPNAARILTGVMIGGDVCDLHMREACAILRTGHETTTLAEFCAVYVWPKGENGATKEPSAVIVPGYWFDPTSEEAGDLVRRFAA